MQLFGYEINKLNLTSNNMQREYPVEINKAATEAVNKASSKQKMPQSPVGMIGMKTSSGLVEEEFLQDLRWPYAGKIYSEMANNDAIIGACLYMIETMVRKATWNVKAASEETSDQEIATFVESCMFDMQDQTWDDFICEALSMITYGFSFHEVLYKVRRGPEEKDLKFKSKFTDGKIGWQELPVRSQASLSEWTFDKATGKPIEFIQDPGLVGGQGSVVKIPLEGNLLFKTKSSRNNPEGHSALRRAYRSWYFKRYIEELEGIGIERSLAGIPLLQPDDETPLFDPENTKMVELLSWAQSLVDGLRQDRNHGVIIPGGWSLKLLGAEGSGKAMDTDTIIHRHESRMAMAMLADIVIMGGDRTGSFALGEVKQNIFIASLEAIVNSICSVFNNKQIPKLLALNSMTPEIYPKMQVSNLRTPSIKEVALLLRSIDVDISKDPKLFNFMLKLLSAPELSHDEYVALMSEAEVETKPGDNSEPKPGDGSEPKEEQDTLDGETKQSDMAYA